MINIKNKKNEHIANSPYYLRGKLTAEYCNCPEKDLNKWYQTMKCNQTYNQIELDMMQFNGISFDMNEVHDHIYKKFNQKYSQSYCNYVILKNKVNTFN